MTGPSRRRALAVAVFAVGVATALALYADASRLGATLGAFAWSAFAGALVLSTLNYAIRFVRWQLYLRWLGVGVPVLSSLRIFVGGFLLSVTPGKVGEVYKSVLLQREYGIPVARTAPIVVAERLTDLLALVALAAVGTLTFEQGMPVLVLGGALVAAVLVLASSERLAERAITLSERIPGVRRISSSLREAHGSLRSLLRPGRLVVPTALGVVAWWAECLGLWLIVRGFADVRIDLPAATFAYSVSTLAGALAMAPGGLGVTELGLAGLVESLATGATRASAVGATLLVRLATLWFAVGLGALAALLSRGAARGVARGAARRAAGGVPQAERTATTNAPAADAR